MITLVQVSGGELHVEYVSINLTEEIININVKLCVHLDSTASWSEFVECSLDGSHRQATSSITQRQLVINGLLYIDGMVLPPGAVITYWGYFHM